MPNILITNDDGIHAPGLRALVEALASQATITVVAPLTEKSASAQSLTLRSPIYCDQLAEREWAVEGTPADAMILAFHTLLPEKPDLVVSGINPGANLGENIYYSGTVGAAMEAAINRVPAIALSLAYKSRKVDFSPAAHFIQHLAPLVMREGLPLGRDAQRQRSAELERSGANHAPVVEDHAQRVEAGDRSARAALFLAERAAIHRRN